MKSKKEIEIKILNVTHDNYVKVLKKMNSECIFNDTISTLFYVSKNEKDFVRFRWYGKMSKIDFDIKNSIDSELNIFNKFKEKTIKINHKEMFFIRKAFKTLGYGDGIFSVKHRCGYLIDECRLEFDSPISSKIPPFLEIEAKNENNLLNLIEKLNISSNSLTKKTYWELMKEYGDV